MSKHSVRRIYSCLFLLATLSACQSGNSPSQVTAVDLYASLADGGLSDEAWLSEVGHINQSYFDALDTNHDGALTLEEVQAPYTAKKPASLEALHPGLDANKDGIWQAAEFKTFMQEYIHTQVKDATAPRLIVTVPELKSSINYLWYNLDKNKDGFLTLADNLNGVAPLCDGNCKNASGEPPSQVDIRALDTDGDGKISYAEFQRDQLKIQLDSMLKLAQPAQAGASAAQPAS